MCFDCVLWDSAKEKRVTDTERPMIYQVVFRREGYGTGVLYWNGSLEETQELAWRIALNCDLHIVKFTSDAEARFKGERRERDLSSDT